MSPDGPDFAAASDGDGDRNMILGKGVYVTPSDSLAVLAANAHLAPGYANGLAGVARSMPTSMAVDRVAEKTWTLIAMKPQQGGSSSATFLTLAASPFAEKKAPEPARTMCGKKMVFGRVLLWLNILAERRVSVQEIMQDHWLTYGRNYYSRHDYEAVDSAKATQMMDDLAERLKELPDSPAGGLVIASADQFSYHDPVDGSISRNQGIRIVFQNGSRGVIRLSGTGTDNATIRVYLERYTPCDGDLSVETQTALQEVAEAINLISKLPSTCGRSKPDIMT